MGGPNHTYFMYDRAYWRLRLFIILCVLRMIMAFAVLGAFSVVLMAFGGYLGPLLSLLGSLPRTLGGFQGALGALLGALLGLFGVILTFKQEPPSSKQMKNRY